MFYILQIKEYTIPTLQNETQKIKNMKNNDKE